MQPLAPKLLTEFAGTFVFLSVIGLAGQAGPFGPLAVGLSLMAMVYMGGHVSGAHYNPAVSFGLFLRRIIPAQTMLAYWVVQLIAGVVISSAAFGSGSWSDLWLYIVGPLVGAACAAGIHHFQTPATATVEPEKSEATRTTT